MGYPKPLQLVTLYRKQEGDRESLYRVRVQEVAKDRMVLDLPLAAKGVPVEIPAGEAVRIGYVIEHRAFYTFATVALETIEQEGIAQLVVACPMLEQIRKVQRRNFFRVSVLVDGVLRPTPGQAMPVKICDLSGGGFSFRAARAMFELGQAMNGVVQVPGSGEVHFEAVMRRVEVNHEAQVYLHGFEFKHLTEAGRNKIVKYCLDRQSKLRKFTP
ncbi:flagellar brake protein [Tumebacillus permanentifrigoris]|uniref:C-di-GMP-binding flagellar brake protein YcgR n=1 Tax=Tumebacillus permanentifrigoris TaxID=378543 RepID=A0A316D5D4_9BACL|nr:PilZ domain-containing protein [Tumebacillus permanentifrigoris]PWK05984.1 c-di-GMP-binding flagellar brake protein YcgR [Tumebacillus permanentifrigoris]